MVKAVRDRRQLQLGRTNRPPNVPGPTRSSTRRICAASPCCATRSARTRAALRGARRARRSSIICAGSASRRSSCCRSTPSCRIATCCRKVCAITGATTRSASSRSSRGVSFGGSAREMRQDRGAAPARGRDRSHSRRRLLQSHGGRQRARARRCRSAASTIRATYRLVADNPRHCINDTGTGNTLNLSNARVLQMVMDSLRYWVDTVPRRRLPASTSA